MSEEKELSEKEQEQVSGGARRRTAAGGPGRGNLPLAEREVDIPQTAEPKPKVTDVREIDL